MEMVKLFLAIMAIAACSSQVFAQCGGVSRATPVRSLIASRPILSTIRKVQANAMARRMSACQGMSVPQASCTQSIVPQAASPCPCVCADCNCNRSVQLIAMPIIEMKAVPVCENGRCDVVRSAPVRSVVSSAYQQALASAQYRAANRIRGHSYLDTHRTSGVGWASHDASPNTCLGRGGDAYAVAQGGDGTFYATKFP